MILTTLVCVKMGLLFCRRRRGRRRGRRSVHNTNLFVIGNMAFFNNLLWEQELRPFASFCGHYISLPRGLKLNRT